MSLFSKLFSSTSPRPANHGHAGYDRVIDRTAAMVRDRHAKRLAKKQGLDVVDLTWEDTARFKGSCVGPNISDMTIQVKSGAAVTCTVRGEREACVCWLRVGPAHGCSV